MLNRNYSFEYETNIIQDKTQNHTHSKSNDKAIGDKHNNKLFPSITTIRVDDEDIEFEDEKLRMIIPNYKNLIKNDLNVVKL